MVVFFDANSFASFPTLDVAKLIWCYVYVLRFVDLTVTYLQFCSELNAIVYVIIRVRSRVVRYGRDCSLVFLQAAPKLLLLFTIGHLYTWIYW